MDLPADLLPPAATARYELLEVLGEGSFGLVAKARDRELDRLVALKVLAREISERDRARFAREARLLAQLTAPNVVAIYDFDAESARPYLVTEFLAGRPASAGGVDDPVAVMRGVAKGLGALHDAGLIHRDVKPANIMVTPEGKGVLIDLGLARGDQGETLLTKTGAVVGTPLYLAPEVVMGAPPGPAADWFAWGVTLFELVEGRPLRKVDGIPDVMKPVRDADLTFQAVPGDSPVAEAVAIAVAADPGARFTSARDVLAVLDGRGGRSAGGSSRIGDRTTRRRKAGQAESARGSRLPLLVSAVLAAGFAAGVLVPGEETVIAPAPAAPAPARGPSPRLVALREALSRQVDSHRAPDGRLRYAHRAGVVDDHVREAYRWLEDGRAVTRWLRVLDALGTWLPTADDLEREEVLRREVYPALAHLQHDELLLGAKANFPGLYEDVSPEVAAIEVDHQLLARRLGELEEARRSRGDVVAALPRSPGGLLVELALSAFSEHRRRVEVVEEVRGMLGELAGVRDRAEVATASRVLFPCSRRDGDQLVCAESDPFFAELLRAAAEDRPLLADHDRARLDASLLYTRFELMSMCRKRAGPEEVAWVVGTIDRLIPVLREDGTGADTTASLFQSLIYLAGAVNSYGSVEGKGIRGALGRAGRALDAQRARLGGVPRRRVQYLGGRMGTLFDG